MSGEKTKVKEPLMGDKDCRYSVVSTSDSSEDVIFDVDLETKRRRLSKRRQGAIFLLHALLILIYTTLFAVAYRSGSRESDVDDLGIPFVKKVFEVNPALNRSEARWYTGEPSEALDSAWDRLLRCTLFLCTSFSIC